MRATATIRTALTTLAQDLAHCKADVSTTDRQMYLCIAHLPKQFVEPALVVRAFNLELGRAMQNASANRDATHLRFQWWREALNDIYKQNPPPHPTARALAHVMKEHSLSKRWFAVMVDSRAKLLSQRQPLTLEDVEMFGEGSQTANLNVLLDLMLEDSPASSAVHAASHVGMALGIINVLRTTAFYASKRRIYLPASLLAKHNVSSEQIFHGENSKELGDVVFEMANSGFTHAHNARKLLESDACPTLARAALLPIHVVDIFLEDLQKLDFNVFDPNVSLASGNVRLQWRLMKAAWNSHYQ